MKKLLSMTLVAALALGSLAGCGQKAETNGENAGTTTDDNTLVIGGIGPLTGAAATYGTAVKNGTELAVEEINAAGGVNGMKLKMEFQDDEHDAEKAVNAYNTLRDSIKEKLVLNNIKV